MADKYIIPSKSHFSSRFDGTNRLFEHCWRRYQRHLYHDGLDHPTSDRDVLDALDTIASTAVNDPKSSFYMHGE